MGEQEEDGDEEEEVEEEELRVLLGGEEEDMVSGVSSSLSDPFIFLFLGDVMVLPRSVLTSVAVGRASWVGGGGGGGLGEDKPVGNMEKNRGGGGREILIRFTQPVF